MLTYPFFIVYVFTEQQFAGNQLAVVVGNPNSDIMQQIAREMNYSETTFITQPIIADNDGWDVRIFTLTAEVPFAGHPTLGTAFIINTQLQDEQTEQVILNLEVGQIPVTFDYGVLWMRQKPPTFGQVIEPETIAEALGLPIQAIDTRYPVQVVSTGLPSIVCPLHKRSDLENIRLHPQKFHALLDYLAVPHLDAVIAFCPEPIEADNDLHARMLWLDAIGVSEDPATGSANGNMAGWLAHHRYFGDTKIEANVEQGYMIQRPSLLRLKAEDTGEAVIIDVGGRVRLVAKGELYVE